jgi:hypothetical protein
LPNPHEAVPGAGHCPETAAGHPACGQGQAKAALMRAGRSAWAMTHTVLRHGGRIENVVIIEVSVPRRWLRKSKAGLWYCVEDVKPFRFRSRIGFDQVAKSPVEDSKPQPLRIAC